MLIVIYRYVNRAYTEGSVYINEDYFCDSLERPVTDYTLADWKVPGKVAIPYGEYEVVRKVSPKFSPRFNGRLMAYIEGIPQFSGVLFHAGNTVTDTEGCVLLGERTSPGRLSNSRATVERFLDLLDRVGTEKVKVKIE